MKKTDILKLQKRIIEAMGWKKWDILSLKTAVGSELKGICDDIFDKIGGEFTLDEIMEGLESAIDDPPLDYYKIWYAYNQ